MLLLIVRQRTRDVLKVSGKASEFCLMGKKGNGEGSGSAAAITARPAPVGRGSRREGLLALLRETAAGLTRGEILERMGLKGNKTGEMSVSNALTALTKAGQVSRDGGKYRVAA